MEPILHVDFVEQRLDELRRAAHHPHASHDSRSRPRPAEQARSNRRPPLRYAVTVVVDVFVRAATMWRSTFSACRNT